MPNRRIVVADFGGPEVLQLVADPELPAPGPGEVRLRIEAAGAAFTDVMIRKGMYPGVRVPFTPGYDAVGVVDALGPGATRFAPGDRVADMTTTGSYAEYICLPEDRLTVVPDGVAPAPAVAAVLSYVTAFQMLHRVANLSAGQSLVIQGAGGAVGTAMLDLARVSGVRAIGTDREEKLALIEERGGVAVDARAEGLEARLRRAVGDGVDAAFDGLGGASLARSRRLVRQGGLLVGFGFYGAVMGRGGSIPWDFVKLRLWNLWPDGRRAAFYSIARMRSRHPDWFRADLGRVFASLAEGAIAPAVDRILPLDRAAEAHRLIEARAVAGKIVLVPDQNTATAATQADSKSPASSV